MTGLLNQVCQRFHRLEVFQESFNWRQFLEVFLAQERLIGILVTGQVYVTETFLEPFAYGSRFAKYRNGHALKQQDHRHEDHDHKNCGSTQHYSLLSRECRLLAEIFNRNIDAFALQVPVEGGNDTGRTQLADHIVVLVETLAFKTEQL